MIAALICAVLGLILASALDGWALGIPLALALLGLRLLSGGGERWQMSKFQFTGRGR